VSRPVHLLGVDGKKYELVVGLSDARISSGEDVEFRGLEELLAMTET